MTLYSIFRDATDSQVWYEAISVVEFRGTLSADGRSAGHYVSDVKDVLSDEWFKTNDDKPPVRINTFEVSNMAYVVLFKRAE